MSYEESEERSRSNRSFRTTMDIGMGIFYSIIGTMLIIYQSFANVKIPAVIAYLLGGMMVIGGLLRLYKGIKAVMPQKHSKGR